MDLIADALLLAGALTAAVYCWVLSKRVKGLNDLDTGLGSAIASLSSQVSEMQTALKAAQSVTGTTVTDMEALAERAEKAAENLKLMLATVQEDKEAAPRKSARVRKFPKPAAPVAEPEVSQAPMEPEKPEPKPVSAPVEVKETPEIEENTPAEKLQKDIADKISNRQEESSREELVQALQSILAASK